MERHLLLRLGAFAALGLFAALPWVGLIDPAGRGTAFWGLLAATAGAFLLARTPRPRQRAGRVALGALAALLVLLLALVAAGIPLRFLVPEEWGGLARALADGAATTPGVGLPYRGQDAWVRLAILAGTGLLLGTAAVLAFWPRPGGARGWPLVAAAVLGVLYAVPVVEQSPGSPFLSGAVFAVLAAGFLWLERLQPGRVAAGIGSIVGAAVLGLGVAPVLDPDSPWLNYEALAEQLEPEAPAAYSWDHAYDPLDWPREGREVLRVKAEASAYWRATVLDEFDGVGWQRSGFVVPDEGLDDPVSRTHPEWMQSVTVNVRNLRSRLFVAAGSTQELSGEPPGALPAGQGTWVKTGRPLRRGSTYRAYVYAPRPGAGELRSARAEDLPYSSFGRAIELPPALLPPDLEDPIGGGVLEPVRVVFPTFGRDREPVVYWPSGTVSTTGGRELLEASAYGRWYRLAQRLAAESSGLYDYILRVRDRVQQDAVYTERPRPAALPLDDFLFSTRAGYCQQFSGAMALLLRMAGVPSRVAAGFSPGSFDRSRSEYVVRDVDAHSWVEAFLPGIGWATFDPTPGEAPARSQQLEDRDARNPGAVTAPDLGGGRDLPGDVAGAGLSESFETGSAWPERTGVAVAVLALLGAGLVLRRRGRLPGGPLAPELAELQRALHRSGRTPSPPVTLQRLEDVLAGEPDARAYVRAVRAARFRGDGTPGPTPRQRRALRRALGLGLGLRGRLRALWALPPQPPRRRAPRKA